MTISQILFSFIVYSATSLILALPITLLYLVLLKLRILERRKPINLIILCILFIPMMSPAGIFTVFAALGGSLVEDLIRLFQGNIEKSEIPWSYKKYTVLSLIAMTIEVSIIGYVYYRLFRKKHVSRN